MAAIQSPIIPIVADLIRQHPGTLSLGQGVVAYPPPGAALTELHRAFTQPQNHLYQAGPGKWDSCHRSRPNRGDGWQQHGVCERHSGDYPTGG
jgi:hypothetical protein